MRIRLSQLRRIIKEEVKRTLNEAETESPSSDAAALAALDAETKDDLQRHIDGGYFDDARSDSGYMTADDAADEWDSASQGITNDEHDP